MHEISEKMPILNKNIQTLKNKLDGEKKINKQKGNYDNFTKNF